MIQRWYFWIIIGIAAVALFTLEMGQRQIDSFKAMKASYMRQQTDTYLVTQYSSMGVVIGEWVSDGPPKVGDNIIVFTELGSRHRILVSMPARYEQRPGLPPQPPSPSSNENKHDAGRTK